ncbi:MAG: hypothetical protein ACR2MM_05320 [Flavobacteriaceae bacterium]
MKAIRKKSEILSRRRVMSLLGGGLILPFVAAGNEEDEKVQKMQEEEFQTVLKPDGTLVRLKSNSVAKAKLKSKKLSNRSLRNWLDTNKRKLK